MSFPSLFLNVIISVFVLFLTLFYTTHYSKIKSDAPINILADSENENNEYEWEIERELCIFLTKKEAYVSSSPIDKTAVKRMHHKSSAPIDPPPEV